MFTKKKTNQPDSQEHAHAYCLFLLGLRLRTEGEIKEKMQNRGYTPAVIKEEVDALLLNNYLNDRRFAEIFVDNLKKYKLYGFYQIKKKFMEKRLPPPIIQEVLDKYFTPEDEMKIALRYLKKEKLVAKNDFKTRQKLAGRLKARGFRSEVIAKLIT